MSNIAVLRKRQSELHQEAPKVAQQLRDTEIALDATIGQLANLTQMLLQARITANLSAVVGQDALSSLGDALHTMIKGRASMVDAHNRLAVTGKQLSLDPAAYGGMEQKPAMP